MPGAWEQRAALAVRAALIGRASRDRLAVCPPWLCPPGHSSRLRTMHLRFRLTAGLQDYGAELLRLDQPAQGVDGELKLLAQGTGC